MTTAVHITPPRMLSERVAIVLIGCGGNGSQMLTGLARLDHAIRALGHPGLDVEVFDPDIVSEANIGRQLFSPADVGQFKACVHTQRINHFFGLDWRAQPRKFERSNGARPAARPAIFIVCVDSKAARKSIDAGLTSRVNTYLLDLGNRASDGQVLFGQSPRTVIEDEEGNEVHNARFNPVGSVPLPYPYDVLPELVDTSEPEDDTPSCGLAEALARQELFVNQSVVTPALAILWEFFRHGRLTWHGAFVNLKTGSMRPVAVRADLTGDNDE
ncbi:PRTRC system ThiF family protein [Ralstonia sp. UBA689]|uniref:PRTRC system ThiF family protein n=1 Tax=Ralstonia sp. UBA689 TaxID=1947373 RepID=UPI0025D13911|nr:PRTRC system ThiF family protein [Ralstonia sp. UBA689]